MMTGIVYGIYGAGGFAKEVLPLVVEESYRLHANANKNNIYFIVDPQYSTEDTELNGCKILNFEEFIQLDAGKKYITVAIGNGNARKSLENKYYVCAGKQCCSL